MGKKTVAIVAGLVLVMALAAIILKTGAPIARDFCSGKVVNLTAIEIRGQGLKAVITDPESLRYLVRRPKQSALPLETFSNQSVSFDAYVHGKWNSKGQIHFMLSGDKKYIRLGNYASLFEEPDFTFLLIDSNAPPKLDEVFNFLLSETNRGKEWSDPGL